MNHNNASRSIYYRDSLTFISLLDTLLIKHDKSFFKKDYTSSTIVKIDTIVYSGNFNKSVIFVIAKNEDHYDGYCYLYDRNFDSTFLYWVKDGDYNNNNDYEKDLSTALREYYFRKFAYLKGYDHKLKYGYNMNDIRFWDCPIWQEMEEKKKKQIEFEEEKKNHPENVYEPTR